MSPRQLVLAVLCTAVRVLFCVVCVVAVWWRACAAEAGTLALRDPRRPAILRGLGCHVARGGWAGTPVAGAADVRGTSLARLVVLAHGAMGRDCRMHDPVEVTAVASWVAEYMPHVFAVHWVPVTAATVAERVAECVVAGPCALVGVLPPASYACVMEALRSRRGACCVTAGLLSGVHAAPLARTPQSPVGNCVAVCPLLEQIVVAQIAAIREHFSCVERVVVLPVYDTVAEWDALETAALMQHCAAAAGLKLVVDRPTRGATADSSGVRHTSWVADPRVVYVAAGFDTSAVMAAVARRVGGCLGCQIVLPETFYGFRCNAPSAAAVAVLSAHTCYAWWVDLSDVSAVPSNQLLAADRLSIQRLVGFGSLGLWMLPSAIRTAAQWWRFQHSSGSFVASPVVPNGGARLAVKDAKLVRLRIPVKANQPWSET